MERVPLEVRQRSRVLEWKVRRAPAASDIIWDNMQADEFYLNVKSWILLFILFVLCVVVLTDDSR